jgi:HSP20 family protein
MLWANDPFRELERMRRTMDQMFSRIPFFGTTEFSFPLVNLYDQKDELCLVAQVPGVNKEDIDINYQENILSISGKRQIPSYGKSTLLRQEQPQGEFRKTINIPSTVKSSEIKATFQDGILTVILPKAEEAKPKQIKLQA